MTAHCAIAEPKFKYKQEAQSTTNLALLALLKLTRRHHHCNYWSNELVFFDFGTNFAQNLTLPKLLQKIKVTLWLTV